MTPSQIASWAIAHPEVLAAAVVAVRALYAVASRVAAPYPRARAVVEGLAALGPDVLRAGQQLGSALLGRPLPSLDARHPEDDRAQLQARIAELEARLGITPPSPSKVTPVDHRGEKGAVRVGALLVISGAVLVASVAGAVLAGCPRLPPVSGCTPRAYRCTEGGRPEVCSTSQRWQPIGDEACSASGAVCVVDRTAHCALALPANPFTPDGGSDAR